jgi:predicted O-methyltransferase YrrM
MAVEPRVKITNEWISTPQRNGSYVTAPLYLGGPFDLMFVDGRLRVDCLGIAPFCLSEGGIVVLHDANRKAYHKAFQFYETVVIRDNTAVLTVKR